MSQPRECQVHLLMLKVDRSANSVYDHDQSTLHKVKFRRLLILTCALLPIKVRINLISINSRVDPHSLRQVTHQELTN